MTAFLVNGREVRASGPGGRVLLDVLRRDVGLRGVKEGCREGDCGACMVLWGQLGGDVVTYRSVNSCLVPVGEVEGGHVVTIEGLNGQELTVLQRAFIEEGATQCGFCTPGFLVALTGYFVGADAPFRVEEALRHVAGNLCRCTGYAAIRRAVRKACTELDGAGGEGVPGREREAYLIGRGVLPAYFDEVGHRLRRLHEATGYRAAGISEAEMAGRTLVAGGTDLFVQRAESLEAAELAFVSRYPHLRGIEVADGVCRIGAATTVAAMEDDRELATAVPGLAGCFGLISCRSIRNRATVAGNLVNASPIGDMSIILLALGAVVVLHGPDGLREAALESFYLGYKKMDLRPGEHVEAVWFRRGGAGTRFHFEKVSRRTHLDIASVNTAMCVTVDPDGRLGGVRVSAGGVAPAPMLLDDVARVFEGRRVDAGVVREALAALDAGIAPITDVRGTAEYKRRLLHNLILAHCHALFPGRMEGDAGES